MLYFVLGWLVVCFLGCALHFAFDWGHHNKWWAWVPAVNESTWEHLKIAFWPFLIWGIVGGFAFNLPNMWFATFVGVVAIFATILIVFYGYQLFTKRAILIVDIISFFVAVGVGVCCTYFLMHTEAFNLEGLGMCGLFVLALCFVMFTYLPPHNFLFKDPINFDYSFGGHNDVMCHHKHCHHCERKAERKKNNSK